MQALDLASIDERLRALAAESPDAAIYCVDPYGAHFVDIPASARDLFRWSLSADTPIELMAPDHRVTGAELFVICRKSGSAKGIVRLADEPDAEVDLHLLNGGDWVIGVAVERPREAGVGVVHRNRVGRIVDVNESAMRLLGRTRTQLLGARLDDFSHPEDVTLCQDGWTAIVADTNGAQQLRRRLRAEDGTTIWVEQADKNVLDTNLGVVITELTDVTETALVEQRKTFEAALDERLADDGTAIAYLRRDRSVEYVNVRWGELTGLADRAPFYEFVAAVHEPEVVETAITRTFGYGKPADATLTLRSHPRGPERRIRMQTRILEGPDGAPGVVVALDEIPQVRLSAGGDARMRRTDRTRVDPDNSDDQTTASASAVASPADVEALSEVAAPEPPPPPPPPATTPLEGGRRSSDPSADPVVVGSGAAVVGAAGAASTKAKEASPKPAKPAEKEKAVRPTPAIGTGRPAVPLDGETDRASGSAGAETDAPRPSRLAIFLGLLVTVAAAIAARVFRLGSHPDWSPQLEVWNTLQAGRIADGEAADVVARNGYDLPTGGLNAFGLADRVWPDETVLGAAANLRWVSAVVGVLGVVALYWAVRRWVGTLEAACAGVVLALMVWHIHFSRLVVGEIFWPLLLTIGVGLLARPKARFSWPLAGAALGATVWFSHAAWLSLAAVFAVALLWALGGGRRNRRTGGPTVKGSLGRVFAAAVPAAAVALFAGLPLLKGERSAQVYGGMNRDWSTDVFADWAGTWGALMLGGNGNLLDASGATLALGWVIGLLAMVGVIVLLVRDRSLITWIVLALAVVMPLGPALSLDESARHALGLAPFVALSAGIAAAWIARTIAAGSPRAGRLVGVLVIVLLVALIGWSSYIEYFDSFPIEADLPVLLGA